MRLLIIEDNESNRDVLHELLSSDNIETTMISDSRLVKSYLEENEIVDVVLLDLEMPYFDGYEILKLFKSHQTWKSVPIVACTIHVSEIQEARNRGFDAFIAKPLDADRFLEQLETVISGGNVWNQNYNDYSS